MLSRLLNRESKDSKTSYKKKVSTPVVLQMHATECGAASLGSVLAYFGLWIPLTELRERCEVSRDGSSAASVSRAARHYGLDCKGFSLQANSLGMLDMPLILFWQFSHFLVLEGFDKDFYYVNDPATGKRRVPADEFRKNYSNIALRFEKSTEFQSGGKPVGLFRQLRTLLQGSESVLIGVIACVIMLAMLSLLIPATLNIFVDDKLRNLEIWQGLALGLLGGSVLVYILTLLKHRFLKRLATRISVMGYDQGITRLLRLPTEFFQHRAIGDLTDRVSSIDRIARNLTEQFTVLLVDILASAVLLVALYFYHALLATAILVLALMHIVLAHFLNLVQTERSQAMRREQGMLISVGMQMLSHIDNLRMTAADDRFFSRWSGQQAKELHTRQLFSELVSINLSLPGFITMVRCALVLGVGSVMVMNQSMSLGELIGFYILAEMFMTPIGRFLEFSDSRKALEVDLQRLDDIAKSSEHTEVLYRDNQDTSIQTFNGRLQLAGYLELKDVTFGYSKGKPPLIKNLSLKINPGQRIAIVGSSGSGKSTLARLIAGIYEPWSGEILFDDHSRETVPEEVMRRSVAMVDQEVTLFSASLRDNITLWNPAVHDTAIFAATRDAHIHDEILLRPDGYATFVEEGGSNFSGGQRQRIEIARALIGSPSILILDEATSALDAATEEAVDLALRRRGVTCFIVAHRLSTVRDCDEIIVLHEGEEVQRGVHDDLITDEDGVYHKLIASDQ